MEVQVNVNIVKVKAINNGYRLKTMRRDDKTNEASHRKASFVYLFCFVTNPEMASTPGGLAMTLPSGLTRR